MLVATGCATTWSPGCAAWRDAPLRRDAELGRIEHDGWSVEARRAPLGVVGFVFEGRPNVFADATGVLRTGNTVVMRIGSDALGTAEAIVDHALAPALAAAGLPAGAVSLVRSPARAAGWALFADRRLALAVARGSGRGRRPARRRRPPGRDAGEPARHRRRVARRRRGRRRRALPRPPCCTRSTARCATRSTCAASRPPGRDLVAGVPRRARRGGRPPAARRPGCTSTPARATRCPPSASPPTVDDRAGPTACTSSRRHRSSPTTTSAAEWEWEHSPEVVARRDRRRRRGRRRCATATARGSSPRSISDDPAEHDRFYAAVDAPFVGDGFTRWVDGQYALDTPELGLSNWQGGRLLGRGGVLSGDSVHTVRYRATVTDPDLHR